MDNAKTKIAIVSHSLGSGGAERFAGILSKLLEHLGFDVHHIIVNDIVDYSFSGKLYNLGRSAEGSFWLFRKMKKGILLKQYLEKEEINLVIDNRTRNSLLRELLTVLIYGNRKLFFIIHSYNLRNYLPQSVFFARHLYDRAAGLICVSKAIRQQVIQKYGFKNTTTIYNPIQPIPTGESTSGLPQRFVLFYGRLEDEVKNFSLLLQAFHLSQIYHHDYQLFIMGDGSSKGLVEARIEALELKNHVRLLPFQKNPFPYVKQARFTILTSHYEGFPMSIIESLYLGTPVISVNCESGPSEIIVNEQNGLLVENYNPQALADAMKRMVTDDVLYQSCHANAAKSVSHLSVENISKQWKKILEEN